MNLKRKIIPFIFSGLILFGVKKTFATDQIKINELTRENLKEASKTITLASDTTDLEREIYLKVNVETVTDKDNDNNIVSRRNHDGTGDFYQWDIQQKDGKTASGQNVWKITRYQDLNYTAVMTDSIYCLQRNIGFASQENDSMLDSNKNRKTYPTSHNMKTEKDTITTDFNNLTISENSNVYSKVLWLLDNAYTKTGEGNYKSKAEYKRLMETANIEIENKDWDLTEDDIDVVQQMAIWYFTNYSELTNLPSIYIDGAQLSSLYYETDEYGVQYTGRLRQEKANKLYKYLIDEANKNADYTGMQGASLELTNNNIEVKKSGDNYIVGPYRLTGNNISSISSIIGSLNNNINYTLLNSSKNEIANNDLSKVIGKDFYLKVNKNDIETDISNLTFTINYSYNVRGITFWSDENAKDTTQPVAIVKNEEKNPSTKVTINLTSVAVEKIWNDNNNQDGKRPENIKVGLYKDEVKVDEITIPTSNIYTWYGLIEGTYTVKELKADETAVENNGNYNNDYKTTYQTSGNTTIITNTHIPEKVNKTVIKQWDDSNNQDGNRPGSVTVKLFRKIGEVIENTNLEVTLDETNNWTGTFENLSKYSNGIEIEYIVKEDIPDGYIPDEQEKSLKDTDTITIKNSYTPGTVNKTVKKEWVDEDNADGSRKESVTVQLYAGETPEGNPIVLNKENGFTHTWSGLPEKVNGENIVYSVKEILIGNEEVKDNKAAGYDVTYHDETDNIFVITNTHKPKTVNKTVTKIWDDSNNQDRVRPTSIKVQLYKDEKPEGTPVTLTEGEDGTWSYSWNNLQATYNGRDIVYTVKELKADGTAVENNGNYNNDYRATYQTSGNTTIITNTHKSFDLSLRKFIKAINDEEIKNADGTYTRQPKVDISTLATTGTATYAHTKQPVTVEVGDIVTYVIRVYNEGNLNGYVSEITDYLPEYLDFLPDDEINKKYLWTYDDENTRKIITSITEENSAVGEEVYSAKVNEARKKGQLLLGYNKDSDELDYIDVEIKCKVNEKANSKDILTNIAEITEMQDEEGEIVSKDRDSSKNVVLPDDESLASYKGHESNKDDLADETNYYKGQEDDDDFEKLIVQKFDLSLKKFIVGVNNYQIIGKEPKVDASKLGTVNETTGKEITDATYTMNKEPLKVEKGDIITYTIRVYNEGSMAGYANEITENIPEGLEFVKYTEGDESINDTYKWVMLDKDQNETTIPRNAVYLTTDYLSDKIIPEVNETENGKEIAYQDISVQFKVTIDPVKFKENIIYNVAQISEASNKDIDSTPSRVTEYNFSGTNEDDIDYEPIQVGYFNLALRKFVTKVDSTDYNNRYPEIIHNTDGSIEYKHTKDPVDVKTADTVIYTIRVYNEGTLSGFAEEIEDNLPEGLEFLPDHEINKQFKWKMLDKDGNETENVITAEKVKTEYLSSIDPSNVIDAMTVMNGQKILSYKDVKIAFKVTEKEMSDKLLINIATITKTDKEDIDPKDDTDKEYVKIQNFDLALKKWVTKTIVTYNGKTTTTEIGFDENSEEMAKVDIVGKQAKRTTVKFVYKIKVINEGRIAGYATEVKDYIPKGLEFVESDNKDWKLNKDGDAITNSLENTLLQPGESATVEITLRWKQSTSNMGVKTNYAEISADSGDDIDSIPDNFDLKEDDIDNASVVISIKTGMAKTYILLAITLVAILGSGTYLIKKYVID